MKTHTSLLSISSINIFATKALRNVTRRLALCASACLLLILASILAAPQANAALEMTSTNNIVVGEIYNDFVNTNDYHFINNGETAIKIVRLIPTCTCLLVTNDVNILKPGEKMKVSVLFEAKSIHGKFSRGLWVVTDEPVNKQTLLRISGEVIPFFNGFPEERVNLIARDINIVLTNQFTFTATTTNYFLDPPQCEEPKDFISFEWAAKKSGSTNIWHLTTLIKPNENMSKIINLRFPVTGPTKTNSRLIRLKLTVGVGLSAAPSKLVATTLTQSFEKKLNISTYVPDSQVELLTWQPQMAGLKVEKSLPAPRNRVFSVKPSKGLSPSSSRTRFECTVSITPAALQELMLMEEPGITFSYPEHQPVTIPIILYEAPAP